MTMGDSNPLFGAIEAGGTKFVCAVGDASGRLLFEGRIPTEDPTSTFARVFEFFRSAEGMFGPLRAIGLASFGPLDLNPMSRRYGHVLGTPKAGWTEFDVRGVIAAEFDVPVGFDTDVNAAALAEARWGRGIGSPCIVYVTVGTGVGAGLVYHGASFLGVTHPEMGHIHVRRHPQDLHFAGVCPFHGDCLEGLASGSAIMARKGQDLSAVPRDDVVWEMEADYLGQLCAQLVVTVSPHRILLGGGVMQQVQLFPTISARMRHWLGGYIQSAEVQSDDFISPPGLGAQAGVKGALALAVAAAKPPMQRIVTGHR